jgi:predicted MPP superfamily phosphohydrolase
MDNQYTQKEIIEQLIDKERILVKQNQSLLFALKSFYFRSQAQDSFNQKLDFGDQYCLYNNIINELESN